MLGVRTSLLDPPTYNEGYTSCLLKQIYVIFVLTWYGISQYIS